MFVTPSGGRCWRYRYKYRGKRKTLSLGSYPYVTVETANKRHMHARQLLTKGVNPAARRTELSQLAAASK